MPRKQFIFKALLIAGVVPVSGHAQDKRIVQEPKFPPVCSTLLAPLASSPAGPVLADDRATQDRESSGETQLIDAATQHCTYGHAVELALGTDTQHNAFLVNPLTF